MKESPRLWEWNQQRGFSIAFHLLVWTLIGASVALLVDAFFFSPLP